METSSPFSFLNNLASSFTKLAGKVQPPTWVVDELHQRLVLLLNHVLMQELEAMARLARVQGQVIRALAAVLIGFGCHTGWFTRPRQSKCQSRSKPSSYR